MHDIDASFLWHAGTVNLSSSRTPGDFSTPVSRSQPTTTVDVHQSRDREHGRHGGRGPCSASPATFTIEPDALWDSIMEASMMDDGAFDSPRVHAHTASQALQAVKEKGDGKAAAASCVNCEL